MPAFSDNQLRLMFIATLTAKTLSILGCLMNFLTVILLKKIQNQFLKIILIVSSMDLIYATFALSKDLFPINPQVCRVMDGFSRIGFFGSIAWTCCFSHYLVSSLKKEEFDQRRQIMKRYISIATTISIVGALFVSLTSQYKLTQLGVCYRQTQIGSYNWENLIGIEIPSIITVVFCGYCYWEAYKKIRSITGTSHKELILYPLIIVICLLPFVTLCIRNQIFSSDKPFVWTLVSNGMGFLQGFMNSIVFGTHRRVMQLIFRRCSNDPSRESLVSIQTDWDVRSSKTSNSL